MRHYEYIRPSNFSKDEKLTKKDIWRGLRENTTVHGVPNLTRARGTAKKVFWVITICLTASAFFYNVSAIVKLFADFPVSVSITLLHESELVFPAVTVCNMSPVRKSAMEGSAAFDEEVQERKKRRKRRKKRSSGGGSYYCDSGWYVYNQHCYWVSTVGSTQPNAQSLCQNSGADLASILDQNEQNFVENIATNGNQYWIGLDKSGGSSWEWTDGQTLGYENWASNEPGGSGVCARLVSNGKWKATICSKQYRYVCKTIAKMVGPTTEAETTQAPTTPAITTQPDTTVADTTQTDTTVADTTHRDTTVADTTQPDTTGADTTQPDITVADTTQPDTTVADTTQPDTTVADTTQPDTTGADTTQPDTTEADTTQPDTTVADTTQPDITLPDTTQPDTTVADTTQPDITVADTTQPDITLPDTTQPDTTVADTTQPDITVPDTTQPDTTVPDTTQPETTVADTTRPDTTVAGTTQPDTTVADTTQPDTTAADTTQPDTTAQPPTDDVTQQSTTSAPRQSSCCCTCCFEANHYTERQTCSTCADHTIEDVATCANNKYMDSNITVFPTSAFDISDEPDPQPVEGSKFPERVETRESYKEEEKFTEVLANVNASEKYKIGFKAEDLILDCQYAGYDCFLSDFETFYNPVHGNCYIFNSGWNSSVSIKKSHRAGRRHGLHMTLNIDQDEYVKEVGDTAGLRLVVHPQKRMPFPEDEGITVSTGHATSIGIRQVVIQREPEPYGNCRDPEDLDYSSNVFEELYPVEYSTTSCIKTCYQQYVISRCGCADPQIPMYGSAFGNLDVRACDSSDIDQDDCKYEVTTLYNENKLTCNCPSSCRNVDFQLDLSSGVWPSNVQKANLLKKLAPRIGYMLDDPSNPEKYKENLIKVEIYYKEFNFEHIREAPSYLPQNLLSDVGGVLGLWLGMSVLTIFEYVEFLIDMVIFSCVAKFAKNTVESLSNVRPQQLQGPLEKKPVNELSESQGGIATEKTCRLRSGRSFSITGEKESGSHMDDIPEQSIEVASSPMQAHHHNSVPDKMADSFSFTETPVDFRPDRRRYSMPHFNVKLNRSRLSIPVSPREMALYDQDSPLEMRGLSPPPPYSSRRSSETSNSSKSSGRSSPKVAWQSMTEETNEEESSDTMGRCSLNIDQDFLSPRPKFYV